MKSSCPCDVAVLNFSYVFISIRTRLSCLIRFYHQRNRINGHVGHTEVRPTDRQIVAVAFACLHVENLTTNEVAVSAEPDRPFIRLERTWRHHRIFGRKMDDEKHGRLHDIFVKQCLLTPDNVAVVGPDDRKLTFKVQLTSSRTFSIPKLCSVLFRSWARKVSCSQGICNRLVSRKTASSGSLWNEVLITSSHTLPFFEQVAYLTWNRYR